MTDYLKKVPTETVSHGDVSITFPETLKNPLTREWLGSSLEKLAVELSTNKYENSKIPKPIREGQEPLTDPDRLTQALTPPGKFLAENITDVTAKHIATFARESLSSKLPLRLIVELGSMNIFSAQQEHPIPPLLDYLFLRQVHDYVSVLKNYPNGLDLSFRFDQVGDQWVYGPTFGLQAIESAQTQYIETMKRLINTNFPEAEFPRINISTAPTHDFSASITHYMTIEEEIQQREKDLFSAHPQARDWQYLYQQIKDPNDAGHTIFNESQDQFISQHLSTLDPTRELGIFRATSRQLDAIASQLQWRIHPQYLDSPKGGFKYSGWIKPQKTVDLTRRFIARELLHNQTITNDNSAIHIKAGSPDIHKQFYRRPGISLKLSGTQKSVVPNLEIPRVFIGQSKDAKLETTQDSTIQSGDKLLIGLRDNKYSIPITIHSALKR